MVKRIYHTFRFFMNILRDLGGTAWKRFLREMKRCQGHATPMVLGWDGFPFLEKMTGVGWYAHQLIHFAGEDPSFEINLYGYTFLPEEEGRTPILPWQTPPPTLRYRLHGIPTHFLFPRGWTAKVLNHSLAYLLQWLDGNDLYVACNFFPPKLHGGAWCNGFVTTIHDLTFKVFPHLVEDVTRDNLEKYLPSSLFQAERVFVVSRHTGCDVRRYYPQSNGHLQVIHSGTNPLPEGNDPLKLSTPYLLFIGTLEPRKNIRYILQGFRIFKERGYEAKLVLAGKLGWQMEWLDSYLENYPYRDDLIWLSYVDPSFLGNLYRHAFCLLFPSLYEGFGFPLLEAQSMNCPVITTHVGALSEIGKDTVLYVDPLDPSDLAKTLILLWKDPSLQRSLKEKGRENAQGFSWQKTYKAYRKSWKGLCLP